jgi:hypothetical protein
LLAVDVVAVAVVDSGVALDALTVPVAAELVVTVDVDGLVVDVLVGGEPQRQGVQLPSLQAWVPVQAFSAGHVWVAPSEHWASEQELITPAERTKLAASEPSTAKKPNVLGGWMDFEEGMVAVWPKTSRPTGLRSASWCAPGAARERGLWRTGSRRVADCEWCRIQHCTKVGLGVWNRGVRCPREF